MKQNEWSSVNLPLFICPDQSKQGIPSQLDETQSNNGLKMTPSWWQGKNLFYFKQTIIMLKISNEFFFCVFMYKTRMWSVKISNLHDMTRIYSNDTDTYITNKIVKHRKYTLWMHEM